MSPTTLHPHQAPGRCSPPLRHGSNHSVSTSAKGWHGLFLASTFPAPQVVSLASPLPRPLISKMKTRPCRSQAVIPAAPARVGHLVKDRTSTPGKENLLEVRPRAGHACSSVSQGIITRPNKNIVIPLASRPFAWLGFLHTPCLPSVPTCSLVLAFSIVSTPRGLMPEWVTKWPPTLPALLPWATLWPAPQSDGHRLRLFCLREPLPPAGFPFSFHCSVLISVGDLSWGKVNAAL